MEVLLNQNYPSSKPQESQGQHPCFDCEHVGVDALPDIKALPTSQAASTVRFIQIPFPWTNQISIYQLKEEYTNLRGFM